MFCFYNHTLSFFFCLSKNTLPMLLCLTPFILLMLGLLLRTMFLSMVLFPLILYMPCPAVLPSPQCHYNNHWLRVNEYCLYKNLTLIRDTYTKLPLKQFHLGEVFLLQGAGRSSENQIWTLDSSIYLIPLASHIANISQQVWDLLLCIITYGGRTSISLEEN